MGGPCSQHGCHRRFHRRADLVLYCRAASRFRLVIHLLPFTVRQWCNEGRIRADKSMTRSGSCCKWAISHQEYERFLREGLLPLAHWHSGHRRIEHSGDRVWRLADFADLPFTAVAQALSRLTRSGKIERLSKGVYYAPRQTALGIPLTGLGLGNLAHSDTVPLMG